MSELQISLIAIGFVVIMVVVVFNWMQHRRYRRNAEQAFGQKPKDVLLGAGTSVDSSRENRERIEPQLGNESSLELPSDPVMQRIKTDESEVGLPQELQPASGTEPIGLSGQAMATQAGRDGFDKADGADSGSGADTAVDYVVDINAPTVIPDSSVTEVLQRKFDFSKPVRWLGRRDSAASWEEIPAEATATRGYIALRGCLQLANRAGPVSEVSLAEFRDQAKNLAAYLKAEANCPDIRAAYARAVVLDEFCAEVDVMIGVNIISMDNSVFTGAKIQVLAESSGFRLGTDGMFHYYGESGSAIFSLGNFEPLPFLQASMRALTTHGITFLLDVSRVENGEIIFGQMIRVAKAFADSLGGIIVDDNRAPLTDNGIRKIRQQLSAIQSTMQAHKIPPGGKVALRLFA